MILPSSLPEPSLYSLYEVHCACVEHLAPLFGFSSGSVNPISISDRSFSEKGTFDEKLLEIEIGEHSNLADRTFTVAHETSHYLHYLKNRSFFDNGLIKRYCYSPSLFDEIYRMRGFDHSATYSDHLRYRNAIRETIANIGAWEFMHRIGQTSEELYHLLENLPEPRRDSHNASKKASEFKFSWYKHPGISHRFPELSSLYLFHGKSWHRKIASLASIDILDTKSLVRTERNVRNISSCLFTIPGTPQEMRAELRRRLEHTLSLSPRFSEDRL